MHQHLREGDCYQANLTFPVEAKWTGDPLSAFDALAARQAVKYGALVDLGGPVILSRSPELFFEIDGDGWIETHPMKGTAPRGKTPDEDEELKHFLANDPKNQAENRMIVDLLRNDISLISEVGTLDVPELFRIESLCHRAPDGEQGAGEAAARPVDPRDFRRAVSLRLDHRRAEDPRDGDPARAGERAARRLLRGDRLDRAGRPMRFNVAIRTITLFPGGEAVYNVGGGVVFDSTAEEEYAGMPAEGALRDGTASRLRADRDDALGAGDGFLAARPASARLYASAQALGFAADPEAIGEALENAVASACRCGCG